MFSHDGPWGSGGGSRRRNRQIHLLDDVAVGERLSVALGAVRDAKLRRRRVERLPTNQDLWQVGELTFE